MGSISKKEHEAQASLQRFGGLLAAARRRSLAVNLATNSHDIW